MRVDILSRIIETKRGRVAAAAKELPLNLLADQAETIRRLKQPHALKSALCPPGINIIAEFKRRSPSKGDIRIEMDPATVARSYERGGAKAISVLTEQDHFAGSLNDLAAVCESTSLAVLRKDFIVDDYQVYESAAERADALLLIVAALDDARLKALRHLTEDELGMDALVEVHDETEMQRAVQAGACLIGVNNRDLRTFNVSIETSLRLASSAPENVTLISESGLKGAEDLKRLSNLGFKGFLIGESLMRSASPEAALRALIAS
jgi:indole-3-glycerol phosphate synthase